MSWLLFGGADGTPSRAWPPPARAPLPAFPPGSYDRVIPPNQVVPPRPDVDWIRANWFSVEVPGLPWVAGQSSEHPEMVLSYFLHKYSPEWQDRILTAHAARGYTHIMLDWAGARADGVSLDQFVTLAMKARAAGFFVHVMLASKNQDPQDAGWDVLGPRLIPVLRALIDHDAVQMVSFWETDLWQGPRLQSNYDGVAAICRPAGVRQWAHFSTERTWWGDYPDRQSFWAAQVGTLTGLLYQADVAWDMPMRQARICDTTNNAGAAPLFANGTFKFCAAEMDGMNVYNPAFSEDLSDQRGFLHVCTAGLTPVAGYCSGGRRPDGSVL